jgi:hypothetical protein
MKAIVKGVTGERPGPFTNCECSQHSAERTHATIPGFEGVLMSKWETYEQVSTFILSDIRQQFGLDRVEPKQKVEGEESGTTYEIDGKGVVERPEAFLIVECRRHKQPLKQEHLAAVAYRIIDTGADGGIVVSPLPVQEGAAKIANARNIVTVQLNADATRHEYLMRFLNELHSSFHDDIEVSDLLEIEMTRVSDGTTTKIEV